MPIYEYECDEQKHRFEKWQSVHDEPIKTCPICGNSVHKVFHPAGIIFKGSGWYITDSRKPAAKTEGSEAKSEAKTETKSETPASEAKSNGSKSEEPHLVANK